MVQESATVLKVKDESIQDSLIDLANYAILMAGYIKAKKERDADVMKKIEDAANKCVDNFINETERGYSNVVPFEVLQETPQHLRV